MHAEGSGAHRGRPDPRHLHRQRRGPRAAVPAQHRQGLGDGRIRHAAARDLHAHAARGDRRQGRRPHAGDPAADRPLAALGRRSCTNSASGRSGSTATSSRPTAARGPRRSPAAFVALVLALQRLREAAPCSDDADLGPRRRHQRRHRRRRAAARPRLRRGLARRRRHERRQDRRRPLHRGAGHGRRRRRSSARALDALLGPGRQPASASSSRCSARLIGPTSAHDVRARGCWSPRPTPASSARSAGILARTAGRAGHADATSPASRSRRRPAPPSPTTRG